MNARDITLDNLKVKMLLYGKSGTWKTTHACSFPRPYVFDFDEGMLSQRGRDAEYDTIRVYREFETKLAELESLASSGSFPFGTIVLDSVTTMQETRMNSILEMNSKKMPTLNEWNILISGTVDLFMRISKLPCHMVVIAHEQLVQDEITGEIMYVPVIAGKKTPAQLPLWFDECYRTQVVMGSKGEVVPQLVTTATTKFQAKTRLNLLNPVQDMKTPEGKVIELFPYLAEKMKSA